MYKCQKEVMQLEGLSFREQEVQRELMSLERMYFQSVLLSYDLSEAIANKRSFLPESWSLDPLPYPPCSFEMFELSGYPVYQLSYEGVLPLYSQDRKYFRAVRDYYWHATFEAVRNAEYPTLDHACIYICHFFKNLIIRDTDNRNRSLLINAVRHAQMIRDDSWKEIVNLEAGFLDDSGKNHIKVLVSPTSNISNLTIYVNDKYGITKGKSGSFEPDSNTF